MENVKYNIINFKFFLLISFTNHDFYLIDPPIKMYKLKNTTKHVLRNYMKDLKDLNVRPTTPIKLFPTTKQPLTTNELFATDKKVIVIGLPGAYTPVCSNAHIPSFLKHYDEIKKSGVDQIVCISVNDPFVLEAWAKELKAQDKILFVGDPTLDFTKQIGAELDLTVAGLGVRSQRYTMIVSKGKVTHVNVESSAGECKLSSGDKIVEQLLKL